MVLKAAACKQANKAKYRPKFEFIRNAEDAMGKMDQKPIISGSFRSKLLFVIEKIFAK